MVRDIVSGIFYLREDAFRIGEYIEFGQIRGAVEGISLRFLRLRHHRGAMHTIPFGEIRWLTNQSRHWQILKLEFRVPFDTDVGLVKELVREVGEEMLRDAELAPCLLEPVKSRGVIRMEEFCMVIGVKFTARPGTVSSCCAARPITASSRLSRPMASALPQGRGARRQAGGAAEAGPPQRRRRNRHRAAAGTLCLRKRGRQPLTLPPFLPDGRGRRVRRRHF